MRRVDVRGTALLIRERQDNAPGLLIDRRVHVREHAVPRVRQEPDDRVDDRRGDLIGSPGRPPSVDLSIMATLFLVLFSFGLFTQLT